MTSLSPHGSLLFSSSFSPSPNLFSSFSFPLLCLTLSASAPIFTHFSPSSVSLHLADFYRRDELVIRNHWNYWNQSRTALTTATLKSRPAFLCEFSSSRGRSSGESSSIIQGVSKRFVQFQYGYTLKADESL